MRQKYNIIKNSMLEIRSDGYMSLYSKRFFKINQFSTKQLNSALNILNWYNSTKNNTPIKKSKSRKHTETILIESSPINIKSDSNINVRKVDEFCDSLDQDIQDVEHKLDICTQKEKTAVKCIMKITKSIQDITVKIKACKDKQSADVFEDKFNSTLKTFLKKKAALSAIDSQLIDLNIKRSDFSKEVAYVT